MWEHELPSRRGYRLEASDLAPLQQHNREQHAREQRKYVLDSFHMVLVLPGRQRGGLVPLDWWMAAILGNQGDPTIHVNA